MLSDVSVTVGTLWKENPTIPPDVGGVFRYFLNTADVSIDRTIFFSFTGTTAHVFILRTNDFQVSVLCDSHDAPAVARQHVEVG